MISRKGLNQSHSAPRKKSFPKLLSHSAQRGQIFLFFALALLFVISVIAFVVNVGLYVKAKINLQNAVDAAAWSGAAVQSRQLTQMAYLNWEMRNTYKEWMFKYYVLGQVSLPKTRTGYDSGGPPEANRRCRAQVSERVMDFRADPFDCQEAKGGDFYNLPSICIHYTQSQNICSIFTVPGLPRFNTQGLPGLDEQHNEFYDQIVRQKSKDCSKRTDLNLLASILWAYGTGSDDDTFSATPQIASQRPGAFPEAFELAIRMRNLERMANEVPKQNLCANASQGCQDISAFHQPPARNEAPIHERTVKAFWSAYRNLAGGGDNDLLKQSFRLTELTPTPFIADSASVSGTLIPASSQALQKHYVDLQLLQLNLATFFTGFVTRQDVTNGVPEHATCSANKLAMPVPGYPFGYLKNPNVLTYYAVKGEADFIGLFNPFNSPTKLVAYAAAKPFGGRIGPHLFTPGNDQRTVVPRGDSQGQSRSYPYILGVRAGGDARCPAGSNYCEGYPIPLNEDFWVQNPGEVIGGVPESTTTSLKFAIPNLLYDLPDSNDLSRQDGGSERIQVVAAQTYNFGPGTPIPEPITSPSGLLDPLQFRPFSNILANDESLITTEDVDAAIIQVRKPTRYEAMNYLIPTTQNDQRYDSISAANVIQRGDNRFYYQIQAPLYGSGMIYGNVENIKDALSGYLRNNKLAIDAYLEAMHSVAAEIRSQDPGGLSTEAWEAIHDNPADPLSPSCNTIAGKFAYFYLGGESGISPDASVGCSQQTLDDNVRDSIFARSQDSGYQRFYQATVSNDLDQDFESQLMTAYVPGPRQGATPDGLLPHPFLTSLPTVDVHRNFYSTKFVGLQSLFSSPAAGHVSYIGGGGGVGAAFTTYSEGVSQAPVDLPNFRFFNALPQSELAEFVDSIPGITH